MSKTWKWILGITLGLVVLAGIGFAAAYYFGFGHMSFWSRTVYYNHPMMHDYGFDNRAPLRSYQNFCHPMMGRRGFYPFGGFFFLGGLLRLFLPLVVLAAVGYFTYRKGKKDGVAAASAVTPQVESPEEES